MYKGLVTFSAFLFKKLHRIHLLIQLTVLYVLLVSNSRTFWKTASSEVKTQYFSFEFSRNFSHNLFSFFAKNLAKTYEYNERFREVFAKIRFFLKQNSTLTFRVLEKGMLFFNLLLLLYFLISHLRTALDSQDMITSRTAGKGQPGQDT
jgi:hypothetical protein